MGDPAAAAVPVSMYVSLPVKPLTAAAVIVIRVVKTPVLLIMPDAMLPVAPIWPGTPLLLCVQLAKDACSWKNKVLMQV